MKQSQINLGELGKEHSYELSLSNESSEDAAARRLNEAEDAKLKRRMTFSLFVFAMVLVFIVFVGSLYLMATGDPSDKKWATGIVGVIISGLLGFLVGQRRP